MCFHNPMHAIYTEREHTQTIAVKPSNKTRTNIDTTQVPAYSRMRT